MKDDLISRQAAIDEAEEWIEAVYCDHEEQRERDAIKHVINGIKKLPAAQPEPCEDCVSRKAVIGLLHSGYHSKSMIEEVKELPPAQPEQKWIPFKSRPLTEEEKEDHPEWDFILDGKLPEDGQRILVNVKYRGHEAVQYDEYYDDGGCYLDSGYEIGTEVTAWMPLPKPYGGEPGC